MMHTVTKATLVLYFLFFTINVQAGTVLNSSWDDVARGRCSDQTSAWWGGDEAIRIAQNVLLYQREIGGWQKNTDFHLPLTEAQKNELLAAKPKNQDCTIDNGAMQYELGYLSRVYAAVTDATIKEEIKTGFLKGVNYLIVMQYDNGGWPQFYPLKGGYANHITYNDGAMIHAMEILRHVYQKDSQYTIIAPDSTVAAAKAAFDKGVDCILKSQYIQNGHLSSWCAQHHYETLQPVLARSYELPSLSGSEAVGVIDLLMSLPNPSDEVKRAVNAAVHWFMDAEIKGQRVERYSENGVSDLRVVSDPNASNLWARFYDLETNLPFFCDRDGIPKATIAEIGYERRNGYAWYGGWGSGVTTARNWFNTNGSTILVDPVPNSTFLDTDPVYVKAYANTHTGKTFEKMELSVDGTIYTSNTMTIDTTFSELEVGMHTFTVTATYSGGYTETSASSIEVSYPKYTLNVVNGIGSGDYTEGSEITIEANAPVEGKTFDHWKGDTEYLADENAATTTITMPAEGIKVFPIYKNITLGFVETGIAFYPNPVKDQLIVDLTSSGASYVEIINLLGQGVFKTRVEAGIQTLNLSHLPNGQYLIRFGDLQVEKLLIRR